jgi:NADH-quinone oxidoreductase subunit L
VVIGFLTIQAKLYGEFFKDSIFVDLAKHPAL